MRGEKPSEEFTPIAQLFEDLTIPIRQLGQEIGVNEVTLARIRDGKPCRKPTANKVLQYFSKVYGQKYTLRNVSGINTLTYKKRKKSEEVSSEDQKRVA